MATGDILIDTSIIIDHFRKQDKKKSQLFKIINKYNLFVSTVTIYELFAGATGADKIKDIRDLLAITNVLPFTKAEAERAGEIFVSLRQENQLIDVRDIFIGATASVHELPVATLNIKHFNRISGLTLQSL